MILGWLHIHFLNHHKEWISEMNDLGKWFYAIYMQMDLIYVEILKNVCVQKSMREIEKN